MFYCCKNKKINEVCCQNRHSIMKNKNQKYKIALIGDCLAGGGAEKVHALLSVYFQNRGLEVHNCIFVDWISYDYSGSLLNLGTVKPDSNFIKRKLSRFFKFKKFIHENKFDAVIDFRMRTNFYLELVLSKFVYPKNTFYTVHSGILEYYFPKNRFLSSFIYNNKTIVAVSKAIQNGVLERKLAQKVIQIYNPIDLINIDSLKGENIFENCKYIVSVGRMNNDVKQFDKLILAYSKSILPSNKIHLILIGEGENLLKYSRISEALGLKDLVIFKGFVDNPFQYYHKAIYTVLSSKNEGFPNVIMESLASETPVISFNCFSGPSEIIIPNENGILVEDQNFEKLTQAMNTMVEDEKLYNHCKSNAKASATHFDIEIIGKQWLEVLK